MFLTLVKKTAKDNRILLIGCSLMGILFCASLVWGVSQIKTNDYVKLLNYLPERVKQMIQTPPAFAASPAGRIASGYSHPIMVVLIAYWAIARGANSVSGRLADGTMEMLLAQPISRMAIFNSHALVTFLGCFVIGFATWIGTVVGINFVDLEKPVPAMPFIAASANIAAVGFFLTGLTTLLSSFDHSRSRTIGIMVAFCSVEGVLGIIARQANEFPMLKKLTFFSLYQPQTLVHQWVEKPELLADTVFDCYAPLIVAGLLSFAAASVIFQQRDLPAPL